MPTPTATHAGPQSAEFMARVLFPARPITVEMYHQLLEIGYLAEGDPIELLEGYMVRWHYRTWQHNAAIDGLDEYLRPLVPDGWFARSPRAVTFDDSEPEPDFVVIRGPRGRYHDHHPSAADIGFVAEVADNSLSIDRFDKARMYARAGIPVYWVVNILDRQIEVMTQPAGPGYVQRDVYPAGSTVPVVLDGVQVGTVAVADILG